MSKDSHSKQAGLRFQKSNPWNGKIKQKTDLEISSEDHNWITDRPERLDESVAKKATEELNRKIIETH